MFRTIVSSALLVLALSQSTTALPRPFPQDNSVSLGLDETHTTGDSEIYVSSTLKSIPTTGDSAGDSEVCVSSTSKKIPATGVSETYISSTPKEIPTAGIHDEPTVYRRQGGTYRPATKASVLAHTVAPSDYSSEARIPESTPVPGDLLSNYRTPVPIGDIISEELQVSEYPVPSDVPVATDDLGVSTPTEAPVADTNDVSWVSMYTQINAAPVATTPPSFALPRDRPDIPDEVWGEQWGEVFAPTHPTFAQAILF